VLTSQAGKPTLDRKTFRRDHLGEDIGGEGLFTVGSRFQGVGNFIFFKNSTHQRTERLTSWVREYLNQIIYNILKAGKKGGRVSRLEKDSG